MSQFYPSENSAAAEIVSAAIYPPIGVMRVGNSATGYFIGPEVAQPLAQDLGFYRDADGALKRQAARFRIYGLDAAGQVVQELTADNASIRWQARLANQKASWYEFQLALDIPEAAEAPPSLLRNAAVTDRSTLLIDGGQHQVSGRAVDGKNAQFVGTFTGVKVYLGEMRTDAQGRLLMLGGHGVSANPAGQPAVTFGNNEGWYDDTSDGPVTAEVSYLGRSLVVKPAWVICAPPDYAPMQKSVRTMWDLMRDVAVQAGMLPKPGRPSFMQDILPIFQRMTDLQWVNAGFAAGFGWNSAFDFTSADWLNRLADPSPVWREARRALFHNFRSLQTVFSKPNGQGKNQSWDPSFAAASPQQWPWLYGDAMSVDAGASPRQFVSLTSVQLTALAAWAEGDFEPDFPPKQPPYTSLDQVPLPEQPQMLTQAAMEFCLADAFHPGCEMTWPMRTAGMYSEAFRLRHASDTAPVHGINYGAEMTPQIALQANGPICSGQVAGGITRWMAIPWQTDTASCRDGYNLAYDPYLPTFWPARVPNNMLDQHNYQIVLNEALPIAERQRAFNERQFWLDDLPIGPSTDYLAQINSMISHFADLALVLPQTQPGVSQFPTTMQVGIAPAKAEHAKQMQLHSAKPSLSSRERRQQLAATDKANRFRRKG